MKRAQIISLDFIAGLVLFLLFLAAFVTLTQNIPQQELSKDDPYLYAHTNLERNLQATEHPFYINYRIHQETLQGFEAEEYDINELTLGNTNTQGLGVRTEAHNTCLEVFGEGIEAHEIGDCIELREQCTDLISISKPALYNTNNYENNRIVQVRLLICKE